MTSRSDLHNAVWVYCEAQDGRLRRVSLELLGKAGVLARDLGVRLVAFIAGSDVSVLAAELVDWGADIVLLAEDQRLQDLSAEACTTLMANQARQQQPSTILFGSTLFGQDLAPRLAMRLETGLTSHCIELSIDGETGMLLQTKGGFEGRLMFTFCTPCNRPQMATVAPGVFPLPEKGASRQGEIVRIPVDFSPADLAVRVLHKEREQKEQGSVQGARVVVGAGAGVGGANGMALMKDLAKVLEGAIGVTRIPLEEGWASGFPMIGQTGETVSPDLYVACGVSGAGQHLVGVEKSRIIVAINNNRRAEIFGSCDYGVVGDLHEVVPCLIGELKAAKDRR